MALDCEGHAGRRGDRQRREPHPRATSRVPSAATIPHFTSVFDAAATIIAVTATPSSRSRPAISAIDSVMASMSVIPARAAMAYSPLLAVVLVADLPAGEVPVAGVLARLAVAVARHVASTSRQSPTASASAYQASHSA